MYRRFKYSIVDLGGGEENLWREWYTFIKLKYRGGVKLRIFNNF